MLNCWCKVRGISFSKLLAIRLMSLLIHNQGHYSIYHLSYQLILLILYMFQFLIYSNYLVFC